MQNNNSNTSVTEEYFRYFITSIQSIMWYVGNTKAPHNRKQNMAKYLTAFRSLSQELLGQTYIATSECVVTAVAVWFSAATNNELSKLQNVVRSTERLIGRNLPSKEMFSSSARKQWEKKIITDQSHPRQKIFELFPSSRCFRSMCIKTSRQEEQIVSSFVPSHECLIFPQTET